MKKRMLSLLLALCMVLTMLPGMPLTALAVEQTDNTVYRIEETTTNGVPKTYLVITGTTDGSDLPAEGYDEIRIESTGVVTGGTYTVDVDNHGTIKGGSFTKELYALQNYGTIERGTFDDVMNRGENGEGGLITGGTFDAVSNYAKITGGTIRNLTNGYQAIAEGATVTESAVNNQGIFTDLDLPNGPEIVTNRMGTFQATMSVNGENMYCPVGGNVISWLGSGSTWYKVENGQRTLVTAEDVFPHTKAAYSSISLGLSGVMTHIDGYFIALVGDTIGVFNTDAKWTVDGAEVEDEKIIPRKCYTVQAEDLGKEAVAVLTTVDETIKSAPIRIVEDLRVTLPEYEQPLNTLHPTFNWQLENGMSYQWYRDGEKVDRQTFPSYPVSYEDEGHVLTLVISYRDTTYTTNECTVADTFTVTFDHNYIPEGETESDKTTVSVKVGGSVTRPEDPTWTGHSFQGWYTEEGEAYDFDAPVTGDITLTAKWKAEIPAADFTATGYDCGTLTNVAAGMQYSLDQGDTWVDITADTVDLTGLEPLSAYYDGKSRIWVKMPGNGTTTVDSEIQKINVYRESAPSNVTSSDYNMITGVTSSMEYRKAGAEQWTRVPEGAMSLSGLEAGVYEVRTAAVGKYLASDSVRVTVEDIPVYTITYETYGGTINGDYATEYTYGEGASLPTDVTRPMYHFRGWSDSDKAFNKVTEISADASGDKTFYAWWETATYTVTFHANNGTDEEAQDVSGIVGTYNLPGCSFTAPEGNFFNGWATEDGKVIDSLYVDKDTDLYATWKPATYLIDWMVRGWDADGTDAGYVQTSVVYGEAITAPKMTWVKKGYLFSGWEDVPATMPADNIVIYGEFIKNFGTVTWTVDGEIFATTQATFGEAIPVPEDTPEKTGYAFTGWVEVPQTMPNKDNLTIEAGFQANTYQVNWCANGGYFFNRTYLTRTTSDQIFDAVIATPPYNAYAKREGYTFTGWNTKADGTGEPLTAETRMTEASNTAVIYYAQWDANQYTITFDTDGGTEIAPITQDYGTAVTAPADPTKEGYTFASWDKEIPATMPAENVTITATWTVNAYTITFDTDGGTEIAPITQDYGTAVTAPADPTKEGYTFARWDKEIPATMPAGDVTITATWTVNSYTVTFAVNGEDYKEVEFAYGEKVVAPAYEIPAGHTFSGWTVPETMPAEDITLDATLTINQYTITWKDDQGNTLYTEDLYYGTMPAFDAEQSDKELSKACHILSWSPEIVEVTENAIYTAVWTLDHSGETEVRDAREATCTEEGYTGDTYCLGCGEKLKDGEAITAPGHSHGTEWESDEKQHWHECECGDKADIADHTGGEATCKEPAQCEICGEAYGETDPENHTGETEIRDAKEATDTEDGYTGDTYCLDCGALLQKGEVIPATKPSVPSTPVKPLWKIWLEKWHEKWHDGCDKVECDHEYTDEVVEPTCCQKGYTVHTCDKCGFKYCDTYTEALGHAWDEGEVTREASCTGNGEKTYTCEVCGETRTEVICATGHDYEDGTCTHCGEAEKPCKPCKPIIWPFFWRWLWKAK